MISYHIAEYLARLRFLLTYFLYVVIHGLYVACGYFVQVGEALGEVRNILALRERKRERGKRRREERVRRDEMR